MSVPDNVAVTEGVTAPDDMAVAGSPTAQKIITGVGVALGVAWLIVGLVVISGVVRRETFDAYRLGSEKGALWMQLMLYPFVSFSASGLLVNLVWLAGLVRVARRHLTPASFIRIYSLGTIGVGLIYWLLSKYLTEGQRELSGSYLALFTLHGALAVLAPDERLFPSWRWDSYAGASQPARLRLMLMFAYVVCVLIDTRLWFLQALRMPPFILTDIIGYIAPTMIVLSLMARVRLWPWVVLLVLSDLWFGVWLKINEGFQEGVHLAFSFFAVFILGEVAALAIGLLYGRAEKLYAKHEARLSAA